MRIHLLEARLAIARLAPVDPVPAWATGEVVSITRTPRELSIVCDERAVPEDVRCERGWRAFEVEGPLPFEMVGVASALSGALASAGIAIVLIGTFDTDIVLVKDANVGAAIGALTAAGNEVVARGARGD